MEKKKPEIHWDITDDMSPKFWESLREALEAEERRMERWRQLTNDPENPGTPHGRTLLFKKPGTDDADEEET